ncbi:MAG: replication initiation protein [Vibrio splendidus]
MANSNDLDLMTITQSNSLIEAAYDLKVNERRILLYAISRVKNMHDHNLIFEIYPPDFARTFNIDVDRSYGEVRRSAESIRDKKLWVYEDDKTLDINWVTARATYKDGMVGLRLNPDLRPLLVRLNQKYTSYKLQNVAGISKKYSFRLYEMMKQYDGTGKGTRDISIDFIRERLMLPPSYSSFKLLNQKILKPCIKEISDETDLIASYEIIKEGRKVSKIRFKWAEKKTVIDHEELPVLPDGNEEMFELYRVD